MGLWNNCKFVSFKWKAGQKIRQHSLVTKYYLIATILKNAHICMYEGLAANYFDCSAPDLFDYFQVNNEQN